MLQINHSWHFCELETNFSSFLLKSTQEWHFFYVLKFSSHFFSAAYSFPQPKRSVKCPFITNLVPAKVAIEKHIRKVRKSEERKVKNIGKKNFPTLSKNSEGSYEVFRPIKAHFIYQITYFLHQLQKFTFYGTMEWLYRKINLLNGLKTNGVLSPG